MARKNDTDEKTVSDKAAATRAAIGTRPRQSAKRFVEYFNIISTLAPERIDELFGEQAPVVAGHADEVTNPVIAFREKSDKNQLELAIKGLTNEDPLNGYANFVFDAEKLAENLREKKARAPRTVKEKAEDLLASASPEDLAELAALLKAQGVEV